MNLATAMKIQILAVLFLIVACTAPPQQTTSAGQDVAGQGLNPPGQNTVGAGNSTDLSVYTMADVATHADASSCWTAINGQVYDLTAWISKHPGGAANILRICGIDGTAGFEQQHGSQTRPEAILGSFKIGVLG